MSNAFGSSNSPEKNRMPDNRPEVVVADTTGERGQITHKGKIARFTVLNTDTDLIDQGKNVGFVIGPDESGQRTMEMVVRKMEQVEVPGQDTLDENMFKPYKIPGQDQAIKDFIDAHPGNKDAPIEMSENISVRIF